MGPRYIILFVYLLVIHNAEGKMSDRKYKLSPADQCGRDECGGSKEVFRRMEAGENIVCYETPRSQQRFSALDACYANCSVRYNSELKIHDNTIECLCKKACPLDHVRYCAAPGKCGLWAQECDKVCTGEAKFFFDQCLHPCYCNEKSPYAVC